MQHVPALKEAKNSQERRAFPALRIYRAQEPANKFSILGVVLYFG